jgi:hypothetical protein
MGSHLLNSGGSDGARGPWSRHGRRGALATYPWSADCAKSVSRALGTARSTRDEPVNLSDSRPETHQHWSPADANCCQSLLLDPDATIGIDLHKRLFLLVTGRGELPQVFPYHGCALPTELGGRDVASALLVGLLLSLPPVSGCSSGASSSATRQHCGSGQQQAPTRGGMVHGLHRGCPTLPRRDAIAERSDSTWRRYPGGAVVQAFDDERYGPPETLRMVEVDTPTPNAEEVLVTARELELLSGLIEAGRLRPRIDRRYRLAELPAAIAYGARPRQGHGRRCDAVTSSRRQLREERVRGFRRRVGQQSRGNGG